MKTLFLVTSLLVSLPTFAGSCVVLDYQELKEMPVDDLVREACINFWEGGKNLKEGMANIDAKNSPKPFPNHEANQKQCFSQGARIQQVLKLRHVLNDSTNVALQLFKICQEKQQKMGISGPGAAK